RGASHLDPRCGEAGGNMRSGDILVEVARFKHRRDHLDQPGRLHGGDIFGAQHGRLAPVPALYSHRMGKYRAFRFIDADRPELHAATVASARSVPRVRRACTIWASTATAISAGLEAAISRPI